ncbi:AlpA family phage regulatory protein [Alkalimonas sp. MEB108]|uniref:AlpA family phage regulatory protein n=1 Tax=Alkalimonas cellulosilytica TaxID=3058395 RepID=A0ABU7J103_9GAMM|nr:AlpA family phage regulatory protein [Alkalimonas sp. MEB108]MEE2000181.1 AlpA family phage regulatory protein [Alkalimonas sp. MEB108]
MSHKLLDLNETKQASGFSRPHIYKLISLGQFPKPIALGRRSFWIEAEINQWIKERIDERNSRLAAE